MTKLQVLTLYLTTMFASKNLYIALMLIICVMSYSFQCQKKLGCQETVFNFQMGIKAYPDKDTINVGDTIWLEIIEPVTLTDVQTGRTVDFSGAANLGSALAFHKLSTDNRFTIPAADKFMFLLQKGEQVASLDPSYGRQYLFVEETGTYLFRLGIIPKESGVYSILFSNAANVYRKNDECTKAAFGLNFKNTNQHYYLHPFYTGGPTPVGGDYYFKVL